MFVIDYCLNIAIIATVLLVIHYKKEVSEENCHHIKHF